MSGPRLGWLVDNLNHCPPIASHIPSGPDHHQDASANILRQRRPSVDYFGQLAFGIVAAYAGYACFCAAWGRAIFANTYVATGYRIQFESLTPTDRAFSPFLRWGLHFLQRLAGLIVDDLLLFARGCIYCDAMRHDWRVFGALLAC